MLRQVVVFCVTLSAQTTLAAEVENFTCLENRDEWQKLEFANDGVSYNNFTLRSHAYGLADDLQVAELTFSIANRSDRLVSAAGQFVFRDENGLAVMALAAHPEMTLIAAAQTATAVGKTIIKAGQIKEIRSACYQIVQAEAHAEVGAK